MIQDDPHWRDHLLFYEYFHGDSGAGLGASHQTGWTRLVAELIQRSERFRWRPTQQTGDRPGGNGGGVLVAAPRRLQNFGAQVRIVITRPDAEFAPVPAHQLGILRRMGIDIAPADALATTLAPDLILDGVIGCSLRGAPNGVAATLIRWANSQQTPTLALDGPSGVDTTAKPCGHFCFLPSV